MEIGGLEADWGTPSYTLTVRDIPVPLNGHHDYPQVRLANTRCGGK